MSLTATWVSNSVAIVPYRQDQRLWMTDREIESIARERGPSGHIVAIHLQTMVRQLLLRYGCKINFRARQNDRACAAYREIHPDDFAAINARQAWANWRTIPRSLNRELPNRAVVAIDLCCGVGESTEVLAFYCAPGSSILGLDMNAKYIHTARRRTYCNRGHRSASVQFREQSVLETFCDHRGTVVGDESVDLVNASGAVGCHFDREATDILARECARVIRLGGLATIDAGREGTQPNELAEIFHSHGFEIVQQARSCFWDRYVQFCLRKVD
jgi:SAM-dependent methyltransferase